MKFILIYSFYFFLNFNSFETKNVKYQTQQTTNIHIHLFKVKNRDTRIRCEINSKLPTKTPEQLQWRCSVVFIVSFKDVCVRWVWFFYTSIVYFNHFKSCPFIERISTKWNARGMAKVVKVVKSSKTVGIN